MAAGALRPAQQRRQHLAGLVGVVVDRSHANRAVLLRSPQPQAVTVLLCVILAQNVGADILAADPAAKMFDVDG
jgi:hypothetical protein